MAAASPARYTQIKIGILIGVLGILALGLLLVPEWNLPPLSTAGYWNGVVAFLVTAFLCDAWFLRISFANLSSSVAFLPFFASVILFDHPVPMLISGLTAAAAETFVRRKPAQRVLFNTAQYMLALGLGGLVYSSLGGTVGLSPDFQFHFWPFLGLVLTYFVVNQGSVAMAVATSSGITIREAWDRIGGGARLYDLLASSLAILLAFLYVKLQFLGLVIVVFPIFLVRQLYQMNLQLQDEMEEKLELMVKAIEARDPYTSGHSRRVAEYASAMARELGLSARQVDAVKRAALLHDVGKIYEEFAPLLRKEAKLSAEERIVMQTHVTRSAELVGTVSKLRGPVLDAIRHHHENYDGTGYPDGLSGEGIPVGARIIMIADTLDAMTTDRPYRKALSYDQVVDELRKFAGRQFDPHISEVLIKSTSIQRLIGVADAYSGKPTTVATFAGRFGIERGPKTSAALKWRESDDRPLKV
jgi:putative nucleotidyltransferase with HDIG domain